MNTICSAAIIGRGLTLSADVEFRSPAHSPAGIVPIEIKGT
jgi:hypothetical protein